MYTIMAIPNLNIRFSNAQYESDRDGNRKEIKRERERESESILNDK